MVSYKDTKTGREYLNQPDEFETFLKDRNLIGRYEKIKNPTQKPKKKTDEQSG